MNLAYIFKFLMIWAYRYHKKMHFYFKYCIEFMVELYPAKHNKKQACVTNMQYGAIIKLNYLGTLRIGFCDAIQASAAHTAR